MTEQTTKFLLGIYLAGAIATLVFQVAVRSQECTGASNCAISYGKAVVWSVIWPASWVAYHYSCNFPLNTPPAANVAIAVTTDPTRYSGPPQIAGPIVPSLAARSGGNL